MDEAEIRQRLEKAIDQLAAIEHERWAHWQRHVHGQGVRSSDGGLTLPADAVARWDRQIRTSFDQLDEKEKDSDRDQVRRYLDTIAGLLADPK